MKTTIKLGLVHRLFPDGFSAADYDRLSRLINRRGSAARITLVGVSGRGADSDHAILSKALREAENTGRGISY
jgi:hypothetical protein